MWKSRRKPSRETDNNNNNNNNNNNIIDGRLLLRSSSKLNFIHSSLKDVENLFKDDNNNNINTFNQTLDLPSPFSPARRLSIFHRVHLATKLARAFTSKQTLAPAKSLPESNNITAAEKLTKPDRLIPIPGAESRVIVYTTSLRVVRSTFEACRTVRSILNGFRISIDERDLSMDSRFINELNSFTAAECGGESPENTKLTLPRVFIGGRYVGGAEEVKHLHETGELKKIVEGLPAVNSGECGGCGDVRFVMCDECNGSHKCYTEKGGFRSCTLCNENGLVRCPSCLGRYMMN